MAPGKSHTRTRRFAEIRQTVLLNAAPRNRKGLKTRHYKCEDEADPPRRGGLGMTGGECAVGERKKSGEAVGGEEGGHLEDAEVVVALGELGGGGIVDDEGDFGMELEGGSGDGGGYRAFDGFGDGGGLGGAGGEEEDFAGFEDGADAHGDGAAGAFFAGGEKFGVVVDGFLVEDF